MLKAKTSVDCSIIGDRKEFNIFGSHISGYNGYSTAIDFLKKGLIKVDEIITNEFPLKSFKEAFALAEKGDESIKVILTP